MFSLVLVESKLVFHDSATFTNTNIMKKGTVVQINGFYHEIEGCRGTVVGMSDNNPIVQLDKVPCVGADMKQYTLFSIICQKFK